MRSVCVQTGLLNGLLFVLTNRSHTAAVPGIVVLSGEQGVAVSARPAPRCSGRPSVSEIFTDMIIVNPQNTLRG